MKNQAFAMKTNKFWSFLQIFQAAHLQKILRNIEDIEFWEIVRSLFYQYDMHFEAKDHLTW